MIIKEISYIVTHIPRLEQEKLELLFLEEMMSWEEEASEISEEFSGSFIKGLTRKPTSITHQVSR